MAAQDTYTLRSSLPSKEGVVTLYRIPGEYLYSARHCRPVWEKNYERRYRECEEWDEKKNQS